MSFTSRAVVGFASVLRNVSKAHCGRQLGQCSGAEVKTGGEGVAWVNDRAPAWLYGAGEGLAM
jgi:hypothetical protein